RSKRDWSSDVCSSDLPVINRRQDNYLGDLSARAGAENVVRKIIDKPRHESFVVSLRPGNSQLSDQGHPRRVTTACGQSYLHKCILSHNRTRNFGDKSTILSILGS